MSHSYVSNLYHCVFSTKERRNSISQEMRPRLRAYIVAICEELGVVVHGIGGTGDHMHFLLQIPPALSLSKVVLTIKSNSSLWAKKQGAVLGYGSFLTVTINFLIIAFILFLVIRGINRLSFQQKKAEEDKPPPLTKTEELLTEIRDELKAR